MKYAIVASFIACAFGKFGVTMAYFIYKNLIEGETFIHYNGTYHSENYQGILWYLKLLNPNLKIVTIASTEQESIEKLDKESDNVANFILCIPENMTKTRQEKLETSE